MSVAKLMTNILPAYYTFLEKEAKGCGKTKRQILEEALALYMREKRKQEIVKAYEDMSRDTAYLNEMREMAEMGMESYLDIIDQ